VYRVNNGTTSAYSLTEIPDEIRLTRLRPRGTGELLYNTTWTLKQNGGAVASALASDLYRNAALVPASPWLDNSAPGAPVIAVSSGKVDITPASGEAARWWVVRTHSAAGWKARVAFGEQRSVAIDPGADRVLVQAADQAGNLSASTEWPAR
jgi:hypothetical protein